MKRTARSVAESKENCIQIFTCDSKNDDGATISHQWSEPKYIGYHCLIRKCRLYPTNQIIVCKQIWYGYSFET